MCAAASKKGNSKESPETKKTGSCGQTLGCMVLIAAIVVVVIYFIIIPKMRESGLIGDSLDDSLSAMKEKVLNKVDDIKGRTQSRIDDAGDAVDRTRSAATEAIDRTRDVANDTVDKAREKTGAVIKQPPRLIPDNDKDSLEKANIKIYE